MSYKYCLSWRREWTVNEFLNFCSAGWRTCFIWYTAVIAQQTQSIFKVISCLKWCWSDYYASILLWFCTALTCVCSSICPIHTWVSRMMLFHDLHKIINNHTNLLWKGRRSSLWGQSPYSTQTWIVIGWPLWSSDRWQYCIVEISHTGRGQDRIHFSVISS